jgi:hypothetical protein
MAKVKILEIHYTQFTDICLFAICTLSFLLPSVGQVHFSTLKINCYVICFKRSFPGFTAAKYDETVKKAGKPPALVLRKKQNFVIYVTVIRRVCM